SFVLNPALSATKKPDPADFVVRSLWDNTHAGTQLDPEHTERTSRPVWRLILLGFGLLALFVVYKCGDSLLSPRTQPIHLPET
ncbi:hypothetical protein H0H93_000648, partial [Arthromyces matolae]